MNELIAVCGLDCERCEARIATINNDNELRQKVAKEWSEINQAEILPEHINCMGCRCEGIKPYFCIKLCQIRKCAQKQGHKTCGQCLKVDECKTIAPLFEHSAEPRENLRRINKEE